MKKIIKLKSIFYLFLIFNFLLASFPMSALAYPAYIQDSANLAVAGPYDQATAGVALGNRYGRRICIFIL